MASDSAPGITPRRKWVTIGIATLLMTISYTAILIAFIAIEVDDGPAPGPLLAFGLGVVPFVFLVLAFMSGHRSAPGAVLRAMAMSVLVAAPLSALMADAVSGLVAGFGVGGAIALRRDEPHTFKSRLIAVALTTIYVAVIVNITVEGGLFAGGVLPFVGIGIADWVMERRAATSTIADNG